MDSIVLYNSQRFAKAIRIFFLSKGKNLEREKNKKKKNVIHSLLLHEGVWRSNRKGGP